MEHLFIYLVKAAALLGLFWLGYVLLLRQETFFRTNRWYLLSGFLTSVLLPLVTIKKIVVVNRPSAAVLQDLAPLTATNMVESAEINWWTTFALIYIIGISFFMLLFCLDWISLRKALLGKPVAQHDNFKIVDVKELVSPFSYFNYIVFNSSLYTAEELENIINHEKVHSAQHHSVDVLITRLFCIVFWFNPFVWLYKKAVLQNLEFIADSEATKSLPDKRSYQITLLKVTAHDSRLEISNQFFQSLIKKRIVMLNKNQSNRWNSWKYATVIPALAAFMLGFQVRTVAQESDAPVAGEVVNRNVQLVVDKNTSDADLKREAAQLKKEHGVQVKFSKVKRNKNGEITAIKAEVKDKTGNKQVTHVSSNEPIRPLTIFKTLKGSFAFGTPPPPMRIFGNSRIIAGAEDIEFDFDFDDIVAIESAPGAPLAPDAPLIIDMPPHPKHPGLPRKSTIIRHSIEGEEPLVIINGEVLDANKMMSELGPELRAKIKSLKDENGVFIIDGNEINKIVDDAMEQAREGMKKVGPVLDRALKDADRARNEARRATRERTREEMEESRIEVEAAREELKQAKAELEKARLELEKVRSEQRK